MQFKHFQITEQSVLDQIEACIVSKIKRSDALNALSKKFGAKDFLQYNGGGIAAFNFGYDANNPDKTVWKKVKHGFMPKVKTDEYKLLCDCPEQLDYRDIIKQYGLGGEMIIGEPTTPNGGFPMYSSSIQGNRETGFYAIKVPYVDTFDVTICPSLTEIKEWEVVKGVSGDKS